MMMMNRTILLIDGNNLCYRAYFKFANMRTRDKVPTSMLYGFPFILGSLLSRNTFSKVIPIFDGGRSKHRLEILPDYKLRKSRLGDSKEDFEAQRMTLMAFLNKGLGLPVVLGVGQEADDWIYVLSRKYLRLGYQVTILSSDKDFNQLICPNLQIINPQKEYTLTYKTFKGRLGYRVEQAVDYLCLLGDDSDNIPGYRGIGEVKAAEFLLKHSSIKEFLLSNATYGKVDKSLLAEIYKRNNKLINLSYHYRRHLRKEPIPIRAGGAIDMEYIHEYCSTYNIKVFLTTQWISIFKKLNTQVL